MNDEVVDKMTKMNNEALDGNLDAVYKIVFFGKKEPKGTLRDCLQQYSAKQLIVICRFLCDDETKKFKRLSKQEKVDFLEKKILNLAKNQLGELSLTCLNDLNGIINNSTKDIKSSILLGMGLVYYTMIDGEEKYYIPSDVRKLVKKNLNSKVYLESEFNVFNLCLIACHYVYGLVPKNLLIKIYEQNDSRRANINDLIKMLEDKVEKIVIKG